MSWQPFVDNLLGSKCVTEACFAGLDGYIWAKSGGISVSKDEVHKLAAGFYNQQGTLAYNGVTLGGQCYTYVSGTERVVRAKRGNTGLHCMKCGTVLIIALYEDPIVPEQAAGVVEKLGDYLLATGY